MSMPFGKIFLIRQLVFEEVPISLCTKMSYNNGGQQQFMIVLKIIFYD